MLPSSLCSISLPDMFSEDLQKCLLVQIIYINLFLYKIQYLIFHLGDKQAIELAKSLIDLKLDLSVSPPERLFIYIPTFSLYIYSYFIIVFD